MCRPSPTSPRDFTEEQSQAIDAAVSKAVMDTFDTGEETISIALEPIAKNDWNEQVLAEIFAREDLLIRAPAYGKKK
ncbi:hypothetical protein [Streptomyces gobiensis]|uniref:hypothetical protein n=1 Tax=Streptomyces gobiensis TaxID=2875706 RepID=UPI001E417A25|nr:hypothetical protein [Streptomyces gobiensis]UGY92675.1 hypothetical protein test1122_13720 [Streptomyces gobiensis]